MSIMNAIPQNWFSWNYKVLEQGSPIADLDLAWVREAGTFRLQSRTYRIYREKFLSRTFVLEEDGAILARANRPNIFLRSFTVDYQGIQLIVKARSIFGRTFVLEQGNQVLGSIYPEHWFTRKAMIELPDTLPLAVRIFMVWLVLILWRRQWRQEAGIAARNASPNL
jgi:hypothetical protein